MIGFNDLATRRPDLTSESTGWDASEVRYNEHVLRAWRCPRDRCRQIYEEFVSRRNSGRGCPYCAGKRIAVGVNDLTTTHPLLAAEAHGWDPQTVSAGSDRIAEWKCSQAACRYEWRVSVSNRALQGTKCPVCSNKVVVRGFNDLSTTHPEIAAQSIGPWHPDEYTFGSDFIGRWQCPDQTCLYQWEASISHRTSGRGCPDCARLNKGRKPRLIDADPDLAAEAMFCDTRFVSQFARLLLWWRCRTCAFEWRAMVCNRSNGSGCPNCSNWGFRTSRDGYVYLLRRFVAGRAVLKIGITHNLAQRLGKHERSGWTPLATQGPFPGHETKRHETSVLAALDAAGIARGHAAFGDAFDGYTESWWEADHPVLSLPDLLSSLANPERAPSASTLTRAKGQGRIAQPRVSSTRASA